MRTAVFFGYLARVQTQLSITFVFYATAPMFYLEKAVDRSFPLEIPDEYSFSTPDPRHLVRVFANTALDDKTEVGRILARKSDGEPGVKTIWLGMQRVIDFASGVCYVKELHAQSVFYE
jgi:hypothetical protein